MPVPSGRGDPTCVDRPPRLGGRVTVISPHLDDAVFSLGAAIAGAARTGADVRIVTVFAGDPSSRREASEWDKRCGFRTEGEAATARREEDRRACELVGARPWWLPLPDGGSPAAPGPAEISATLAPHLSGSTVVLLPGLPLLHPDHVKLASLVPRLCPPGTAIVLYAEQPYLVWETIGALPRRRRLGVQALLAMDRRRGRRWQRRAVAALPAGEGSRWRALPSAGLDRRLKFRAARRYESQFPHLGRPLLAQIMLWERCWRGETVAPVEPRAVG